MKRHNDSSSADPLKDVSDMADLIGEDRGTMAFSSSASSSKAVLAALRALQDKIRRLESERSQALDETAQLRNQLSNLEIESEHKKRKDALEYQRSLQEIRIINEKVLADKDELERRLVKMEDKSRGSRTELEELMSRIKTLEHEKILIETRTRDAEKDSQNLKHQLNAAEQREKDLSQAMVWETKRHEEEMQKLNSKVQALRHELSETSLKRLENETKLEELDTLVGQLLSVNESLVGHLSGQVSYVKSARRSPSKQQKTKSRSRSNSASRLSTATISSDMKSKKTSTQSRTDRGRDTTRRVASVQTEMMEVADASNFIQLHDMYANMAESITRGRSKHHQQQQQLQQPSQQPQQRVVSRRYEDCDDPPHTDSSISDRTSHVQSRMRPVSNGGIIDPQFKHSKDKDKSDWTSQSTYHSNNNESHSHSQIGELVTENSRINMRRSYREHETETDDNLAKTAFLAEKSTSFLGYSPERKSQTQTHSQSLDVQSVIASLEEEFEALNETYQQLVSSRSSNRSSYEQDPEGEARHAEELMLVIKQLHRKGEQLRSLKSPSR